MNICLVTRGHTASLKPLLDVEIKNTQKYFLEMGHSVDIIMPPLKEYNQPCYYKAGKIFFSHKNKIGQVLNEIYFSVSSAILLRKLIKKKNYDIIQFYIALPFLMTRLKTTPTIFFCGTPIPTIPLLRRAGRKKKTQLFVKLLDKASIAIHGLAFKKTKNIVVNSESLSGIISNYYNIPNNEIFVIHGGVDTELFAPKFNLAADNYNINGNYNLLMVANIEPWKNQLTLIKALPDILKSHSNTKIIFAGPVLDKNYFNDLQEIIHKNNLTNNVVFKGAVSQAELLGLYHSADLVLLLSTGEGFSRVLLEAMACGKATICSNIPENKEACKNGDELIFVEPLNELKLACTIKYLLSKPNMIKEMGYKAYKTVSEEFSWKVVCKKYIELFKMINIKEVEKEC